MTYDVIESSYHHYHGVALDSDGVERRDAECFAAFAFADFALECGGDCDGDPSDELTAEQWERLSFEK